MNHNYIFLLAILWTYFTLQYLSGSNDVLPLRLLFHRAWSTKPLISGVPGCEHVLRRKPAIIFNICYRPLLISVVIYRLISEPLTDFRGRQHTNTESFIFCG